MWVQQLNKIGLISLNKFGYFGERGRVADETRSIELCDSLVTVLGEFLDDTHNREV